MSNEMCGLVVSGEGKVAAVPDLIEIYLTVSGEDAKSLKSAMNSQAMKAKKLLSFLVVIGIEQKNIKTTMYQYGPIQEWDGKKQVNKGYVATQRFNVLASLEKGSELLEGAANYTTVDGTRFSVKEYDALREAAVDMAIDNARARAERRAKKLGVKLGSIVYFTEADVRVTARPMGARMAMAQMESTSPEVPVGETEINAVVHVRFNIGTKEKKNAASS